MATRKLGAMLLQLGQQAKVKGVGAHDAKVLEKLTFGRSMCSSSSGGAGGATGNGPSGSGGDSEDKNKSEKPWKMGKIKDPPKKVFKNPLPPKLGPGANRTGAYKNPDYFSYHRGSFYEMEVVMKDLRTPQPVAIERGPNKITDNW